MYSSSVPNERTYMRIKTATKFKWPVKLVRIPIYEGKRLDEKTYYIRKYPNNYK